MEAKQMEQPSQTARRGVAGKITHSLAEVSAEQFLIVSDEPPTASPRIRGRANLHGSVARVLPAQQKKIIIKK